VKIDVPYGEGLQRLAITDDQQVKTVSPEKTPGNTESIAKSLANPTEFEDLSTFIATRKKLLVVVNDHTRPTPSSIVLRKLDLKGHDVTTIIACGAHRAPNQQEIQQILGGPAPPYGGRLIVHDAKDSKSLTLFGNTGRGTRLLLSRSLFEADGIIVVGSVEPHYFAGYTGGRKFLLPALAGFDSIVMNHSLASDDDARILQLDGNPVHEDFMDALRSFGRFSDIFSIQMVLNAERQVSYTSSGHVLNSFLEAVKRAQDSYVAPVGPLADIVISVAKPPMDLDLYQSQKAIDNVKLAVKDGGIIILVSRCKDGIGDRGFYELLASNNKSEPTDSHKFGFHKAVKMLRLLQKAKVFAVSDLPANIPKQISITPFTDVQAAFDKAIEMKGKESKVLMVLDGTVVVPIPGDRTTLNLGTKPPT